MKILNVIFLSLILTFIFFSFSYQSTRKIKFNPDTLQTYVISKESKTNLSIQDSFTVVHFLEKKLDSLGWKKSKNPRITVTFNFKDSIYTGLRTESNKGINGSFGWLKGMGSEVEKELHDLYFQIRFNDNVKIKRYYQGYYFSGENEKEYGLIKRVTRIGLDSIFKKVPKVILIQNKNTTNNTK